MTWQKFNDKIREGSYTVLPEEDRVSFQDNIKKFLPLLQDEDDIDETYLLWKAELHRNPGEFKKSINVLTKIKQQSLQPSKNKMILLNLAEQKSGEADHTPTPHLIMLWPELAAVGLKLQFVDPPVDVYETL